MPKNALAGWLDGVRHNFPLLLVRFGEPGAQPSATGHERKERVSTR
jgi:hypothetical protein